MNYVKEWHTTGVVWDKNGIDVSAYSAGAPPPAPPAAPAPVAAKAAATAAPSSGAAPKGPDLFAALNKGGAITSGLKTVTKDMQTWRKEYSGE